MPQVQVLSSLVYMGFLMINLENFWMKISYQQFLWKTKKLFPSLWRCLVFWIYLSIFTKKKSVDMLEQPDVKCMIRSDQFLGIVIWNSTSCSNYVV